MRTERKRIHGQWVDVKICPPGDATAHKPQRGKSDNEGYLEQMREEGLRMEAERLAAQYELIYEERAGWKTPRTPRAKGHPFKKKYE